MRFGQRDLTGLRPNALQTRLRPPSFFQFEITTDGVDTSTNRRASVTVTGDASTHTKGSITEVIASTAVDAHALSVTLNSTAVSGADTSMLVDIMVGAASSETVLIPDVPAGFLAAATTYVFPVFVPKGTRLSSRCQGAVSADTVTVGLSVLRWPAGALTLPRYLTTYGTNAAASQGIIPTAPGSLDTKGAWTQVTAATTERLGAIIPVFQGGGNTTSSAAGANRGMLCDVGIWNGASYDVIIPDLAVDLTSAEVVTTFFPGVPFAVNIPRGSQLGVRYSRDNASNTLDVSLVGVPSR
jgi:hypothetical protein